MPAHPFDEKRLADLVKNVATRVSNEWQTVLSKKQFLPVQRIIVRTEATLAPAPWPGDAFAPNVARSETSTRMVTTWYGGQALGAVYSETRSAEEFVQLTNFLLAPFLIGDIIKNEGVTYLDLAIQLIWSLARACSPDSKPDANEVNAVIDSFIKSVYNRPRPYTIKAELTGLALPAEPLQWSCNGYNISIWKTTAEDLFFEFPLGDLLQGRVSPYVQNTWLAPTAILQIQLDSSSIPDFRKIVEKALAILRLCTTGGVDCSCIFFKTDISSDWQPGYQTGSGDLAWRHRTNTVVPACLTDTAFLVRFWNEYHSQVASSLVHSESEFLDHPHLLAAYRRYCSALFNSDSIESRIADIVIGLEALYFQGSDNQEISNRFSNRIAKVFGVLDGNPLGFRSLLKEAYGIRSNFAHGRLIDKKRQIKIEREYSGVGTFLKRLLATLRRSIVIFLCPVDSEASLITLIDDALIDSDRHSTLSKYLIDIKSRLPD